MLFRSQHGQAAAEVAGEAGGEACCFRVGGLSGDQDDVAVGQGRLGVAEDDEIAARGQTLGVGEERALFRLTPPGLFRIYAPTADGQRFLVVQPVLDVTDLQPAKKAIHEIRRLAENLGLTPENGVSVRLTGDVALSYEEIGLVKSQAAGAALGSLVLVSIVLAAGLRSLRMIAAVLATLLKERTYKIGRAHV